MKHDRDLNDDHDDDDNGIIDASSPSATSGRGLDDLVQGGSGTGGGGTAAAAAATGLGISTGSTNGTAATSSSSTSTTTASASATTNFRNVSACNRCRNRKNRCDQRLPRCSGCAKADVQCVGFDPVSKREIPRSYVYYLETRVATLEALLRANSVPCPPPSDDFSISEAIRPGVNVPFPAVEDDDSQSQSQQPSMLPPLNVQPDEPEAALDPALQDRDEHKRLSKLANKVGVVSVHGPSDSRHQSKASGIPFSRVVFAAVKSSVPHPSTGGNAHAPTSKQLPSSTASGGGGSSSFFALHTKPSVKPAPFPEKSAGFRLVELYFEHANPQIPILHRPEFMTLFDRVYATDQAKRTPRELYLLNMVFAIGAGIINDSSNADQGMASMAESVNDGGDGPSRKRQRLAGYKIQPEEYHSSAIVHLDSFLGSQATTEGVGGGLEELQAVLLLAGLALLRPVAPGLWYIIGVAVRLAIDLGLHFEDVDPELDNNVFTAAEKSNFKAPAGRRQWTRDFRRRLWWCTFSFDRLVSTCVGRPVGIVDQVITTSFPTILDDKDITPAGFLRSPRDVEMPTYKLVARHYFRLRLLQSEILQVLQYRQAEQTRTENAAVNLDSESYMRTDLPSPFLHGFPSFRDWRADVDRRLWEWKESAPRQFETGVAFTPLFLELNYWQAVIMLYRQSLAVPEPLAGEMSPSTGEDVQSPSTANLEAKEDEQMVFMKVAQAGQTVLKIYRRLHRLKLVNYTFLATHHLFMSGISFLYAIWHSTLVRSQLTLDDVDFTVLIATSVLGDLIDKCPPAEACRDAFVRMSKATISMCMNTTGFGNSSTLGTQPLNNPATAHLARSGSGRSRAQSGGSAGAGASSPSMRAASRKIRMPKFDYNLKDLFSDEEIANRPMHHPTLLHQQHQLQLQQQQQQQQQQQGTVAHGSGGGSALPPQSPSAFLVGSPHSSTVEINQQQSTSSFFPPNNNNNPSTSQSEFPYSDFDFLDLTFASPTDTTSHQHTQTHNNNNQQQQQQSIYPSTLNPGPSSGAGNGYGLGLWGELDLGFGTGGTATNTAGYDASGNGNFFGGGGGSSGAAGGGGEGGASGSNGGAGGTGDDGGGGGGGGCWDAGYGGYGGSTGGYGVGGGVDLFDGFFFGGGSGGG